MQELGPQHTFWGHRQHLCGMPPFLSFLAFFWINFIIPFFSFYCFQSSIFCFYFFSCYSKNYNMYVK